MAAAMVLLSVPFVEYRAAVACTPARPVPEPTDPANFGLDGAPPIILNVTADLTRGSYGGTDSCSDIGWLWLDIEAEDDQTAFEKLRYRVQDMSQKGSVFYFDEPVSWFNINWIDDGQMALDFRLRIFAIDRGGNESAPFDIRVRDGDHSDGCSMTPAASGRTGKLGLLLLALASFLRRNQRAAPGLDPGCVKVPLAGPLTWFRSTRALKAASNGPIVNVGTNGWRSAAWSRAQRGPRQQL